MRSQSSFFVFVNSFFSKLRITFLFICLIFEFRISFFFRLVAYYLFHIDWRCCVMLTFVIPRRDDDLLESSDTNYFVAELVQDVLEIEEALKGMHALILESVLWLWLESRKPRDFSRIKNFLWILFFLKTLKTFLSTAIVIFNIE